MVFFSFLAKITPNKRDPLGPVFLAMFKFKKKKIRLSLATRLAVSIFLVNALVLTFLGVYYARNVSSRIEEELVSGSSIPALLMRQGLEGAQLVRDPDILFRLVGRPVDQAMLITPEGSVRYSLKPEFDGVSLISLSPEHPVFKQITRSEHHVDVLASVVRTPESRNIVSPVYRLGENVGYLWLSVDTAGDNLSKKKVALFFFVGGIAAILLASLSQFFFVHHLIVPRVRRMARCVNFIEEGELRVRIAGSQLYDELGGLETSINQMVVELESRAQTQNKLMEELASSKELAEAASQHKSEFMERISTEMRAPMNAVIGVSELLMDTPLDEGQQEQVKAIIRSGEWLSGVFSNIIAMVDMENQRSEMKMEPISLRALFDEMRTYYTSFAQGCGLELECYVEEDLPEEVISSRSALQRIFGNLLLNGLKFTNEGYVRLSAGLFERNEEENRVQLMFSVQDSGIGISDEDRKSIFESFQFGEGANRKYGGVGLGLSVAQRLVSQLGGELEFNSEVGEGSSFFFTLDMALPDALEGEDVGGDAGTDVVDVVDVVESATSERSEVLPSKEPRVLLVANDNTNKTMLTAALERMGCAVSYVESSEKALEMLGADKGAEGSAYFDLVLADSWEPQSDSSAKHGLDAVDPEADEGVDSKKVIFE